MQLKELRSAMVTNMILEIPNLLDISNGHSDKEAGGWNDRELIRVGIQG